MPCNYLPHICLYISQPISLSAFIFSSFTALLLISIFKLSFYVSALISHCVIQCVAINVCMLVFLRYYFFFFFCNFPCSFVVFSECVDMQNLHCFCNLVVLQLVVFVNYNAYITVLYKVLLNIFLDIFLFVLVLVGVTTKVPNL